MDRKRRMMSAQSTSVTQQLMDGAPFVAQLTKTLALQRGTGSPNFTRATAATVMGYGPTANSGDAQTLLTAASGEARFEGARRISEGVWSDTFADGALIPSTTLLGYKAEGARTNLCLQSQTLGTTWATDSSTGVTENQYVAPDGTTTMDKITSIAITSQHYLRQGITFSAGVTTYSCYLRYINNQWAALIMSNGGGLLAASFDLLNGVVGALGAGTTSTIEPTSIADVYRVSITGTMSAGAGNVFISPNATDYAGNENYTAAGTETVGSWGAQLELGSFASSYIPTTTIAVARNADIDSTTASGNITAAAGSVYFEFTPTHSPSGTIAFWGTYVDASNYTAILHDATNLIFRKRIAGINYDATIANAFVAGTTYKACGTWGAAGVTITLNGTDGTPSADTTAAQIAATMQWGADGNSLQQPFASVRNCRDWLRQLSSSERRAITA